MVLEFRLLAVFLATFPWLFRSRFPVNKFSDNYEKDGMKTWTSVLYRIKKYQYVFYKHFLLHGLNLSVALHNKESLAPQIYFRLYWISLNAAYVMEFFLQTLVKRKYMMQTTMLFLNQTLMVISTIAALQVLSNVNIMLSFLSLVLNFAHRGHELQNMLLLIGVAYSYVMYNNAWG